MKIAVVHDYFTQLGGAEKVADELFQMMPSASLFSLVALKSKMPDALQDVPIRTSWMQYLPGMDRYYRLFFLLYPFAVGSFNLEDYDLVLSSSSGYAKGIRTGQNTVHVCYCHTPMRWVWSFDSYSQRESLNWGIRSALTRLLSLLKMWDEAAARQPDHFVANSATVAARIKQVYGRTAEVIHPPIDIARFHPSTKQGDYYLVLSRLISYKRLDLAIEACTRLNRKLLVVGDGPHKRMLMVGAGPSVVFCGRLSDEAVNDLAAGCRALIFPGEEDFGMAPIEVAAAGRPTIAFKAGGALETVIDGVTGVFFEEQTPEHLMAAIVSFEKQTFSQKILRKHAEGFSIEVFRRRITEFLFRVGVPVSSHPTITALPYFVVSVKPDASVAAKHYA